jgi:hypothetical protein
MVTSSFAVKLLSYLKILYNNYHIYGKRKTTL